MPRPPAEQTTLVEPTPEKLDRFKPAMPRIPGVTERPAKQDQDGDSGAVRKQVPRVVLLALALVLTAGAGMLWWTLTGPGPEAEAPGALEDAAGAPSASTATVTAVVAPGRPAEVAAIDELAKPWAAKRFFVSKRLTNETVPALVVRLPGGAAERSGSYWALSLQAPYGHCELEFVTDLNKLAREYGYRARHPMIGDPCSGTLFDPLSLGTLPGGAWARGAVVQGSAIRPPFAIEVRVEGRRLIATQIE